MPSTLAELDLQGTGSCASFNFRRPPGAVTRFYDQAFRIVRHPLHTNSVFLLALPKTNPLPSPPSRSLGHRPHHAHPQLAPAQKTRLLSISDRSIKRQRFLCLTPKGERTLAATLPAWRKAQDRSCKTLGLDYWAHFPQ